MNSKLLQVMCLVDQNINWCCITKCVYMAVVCYSVKFGNRKFDNWLL